MRRLLLGLCSAAALAGASHAHAQGAEAPLSLKSAKAFFSQLGEMGYSPDLDTGNDNSALITTRGDKLLVILGGCEGGANCKYAVLFAFFKDAFRPTPEQLNKLNADYDMIKVWINADGKLIYTMGVMPDGMPRAVFRANVDMFEDSSVSLAADLLKLPAGKTAEPPQKP